VPEEWNDCSMGDCVVDMGLPNSMLCIFAILVIVCPTYLHAIAAPSLFPQTGCINYNDDTEPRYQYWNFGLATAFLSCINDKYPSITHLYSIGRSVQGW